jgi:transmembrane sensor
MDRGNEEQLLLTAARWHARLQAADCTPNERTAFEAWRDADPSHARAYAVAERVSDGVDHLQLVDPRFQALTAQALKDVAAKPRPSRPVLRWAVPATLVAGLACAMIAFRFAPSAFEPAGDTVAYQSELHTQRVVHLADGSKVQLDAGSRMLVAMTPQHRSVQLQYGRAVFDVAKDKSRPFSVAAANSQTMALGTRFQVDLQQRQVIVTLVEGAVSVDHGVGETAWQERLSPGEQLTIDVSSAKRSKAAVDSQLSTIWTQGRHAFRGTPLRQALDEVNRYSHRKVRLGDPTLADLPVAGNFIVGDSEAVVTAFTALLPLRVVASGDDEVILFRRYDDTGN